MGLVIVASYNVDANPVDFAEGIPNLGVIISEIFVLESLIDDLKYIPTALWAMLETLQMAFIGTVIGVAIGLPLSMLAARNLNSKFVYAPTRALMQKPTILLADEIVSELDHVTAREIMDLILDAQKKMNLTAIMVHHDMALALEYANRVAVMKEGKKILEIGVEGDAIVDFQAGDMSIEEIMEMYNTDAKE